MGHRAGKPSLEQVVSLVLFLSFLKLRAGIGRLDFLFVQGAELRKGIHDVVGAVAAKVGVFTLVKHFHLGGTVSVGEDFDEPDLLDEPE